MEGKIITKGDLRVEGTIQGELVAAGAQIVDSHAHVDGAIQAGKIVVAGELRGRVDRDGRLELLPGSDLQGKIQTRTLVVHEGAYIEVTGLKMMKAESPDRP